MISWLQEPQLDAFTIQQDCAADRNVNLLVAAVSENCHVAVNGINVTNDPIDCSTA